MKYITLIIGLLVVGCGTTPTMKSVAGVYEFKYRGDTGELVFLPNGIAEGYRNGKKEREAKWKIVDREIHWEWSSGKTAVFRINKDSSITPISGIDKDGKRIDHPKEKQITSKKIK